MMMRFFLLCLVFLLVKGEEKRFNPALDAWQAVTHQLGKLEFENSSDSFKRAGCANNGVDNGGVCTTPSSFSSSLSFCKGVVDTSQTQSICVTGGTTGATSMDGVARSLYSNYYPNLIQTLECANAFTQIICSTAFNQCNNGVAVGVCSSTCQNFFKVCANEDVTCPGTLGLSVVIVENQKGPSNLCTGAANSLIPSIFLILISVVLFVASNF